MTSDAQLTVFHFLYFFSKKVLLKNIGKRGLKSDNSFYMFYLDNRKRT